MFYQFRSRQKKTNLSDLNLKSHLLYKAKLLGFIKRVCLINYLLVALPIFIYIYFILLLRGRAHDARGTVHRPSRLQRVASPRHLDYRARRKGGQP